MFWLNRVLFVGEVVDFDVVFFLELDVDDSCDFRFIWFEDGFFEGEFFGYGGVYLWNLGDEFDSGLVRIVVLFELVKGVKEEMNVNNLEL